MPALLVSCPQLQIFREPSARGVSCATERPILFFLTYPRQTAFPATRYAAVTPEPSARRPRAAARRLGPAPGWLGRSNNVPLREDPQPRLSQVAPPHDANGMRTRPSILARERAWPAVPERPLQERGKTATVGATLLPLLEASFLSVFLRVPTRPGSCITSVAPQITS